mmetsp:Transcript_75337/g.203645  ORF Transcript_75337/g.203645 Transcript_75337/m.203645 type:complete len:382 (-) Transcript_75337:256-1401(-)
MLADTPMALTTVSFRGTPVRSTWSRKASNFLRGLTVSPKLGASSELARLLDRAGSQLAPGGPPAPACRARGEAVGAAERPRALLGLPRLPQGAGILNRSAKLHCEAGDGWQTIGSALRGAASVGITLLTPSQGTLSVGAILPCASPSSRGASDVEHLFHDWKPLGLRLAGALCHWPAEGVLGDSEALGDFGTSRADGGGVHDRSVDEEAERDRSLLVRRCGINIDVRIHGRCCASRMARCGMAIAWLHVCSASSCTAALGVAADAAASASAAAHGDIAPTGDCGVLLPRQRRPGTRLLPEGGPPADWGKSDGAVLGVRGDSDGALVGVLDAAGDSEAALDAAGVQAREPGLLILKFMIGVDIQIDDLSCPSGSIRCSPSIN